MQTYTYPTLWVILLLCLQTSCARGGLVHPMDANQQAASSAAPLPIPADKHNYKELLLTDDPCWLEMLSTLLSIPAVSTEPARSGATSSLSGSSGSTKKRKIWQEEEKAALIELYLDLCLRTGEYRLPFSEPTPVWKHIKGELYYLTGEERNITTILHKIKAMRIEASKKKVNFSTLYQVKSAPLRRALDKMLILRQATTTTKTEGKNEPARPISDSPENPWDRAQELVLVSHVKKNLFETGSFRWKEIEKGYNNDPQIKGKYPERTSWTLEERFRYIAKWMERNPSNGEYGALSHLF